MNEYNVTCPYCRSMHITTKNIGRKLGTTAGALGGGAHGLSSALAGARAGYLVFRVMGPPGIALGTVAGAVLGAIMGATSFGFMGAKLGELVDNTILDNYRCLHCGRSFNPARFMAEIPLTETPAPPYPHTQVVDEEMDGFAGDWEPIPSARASHPGNETGRHDWPIVPYTGTEGQDSTG
ncbi:hypothetical protein CUZ56_01202 [Saezia sanguinis]|uniref:Uncharacterized protein n=2 Tax=Saezia sanguinis TaxID=1965230 RepID=A0A433SER2_9BURK|nr:hypothetical protein CUZ56_01202 [Saezia sanguinis]